MAFVNDFSLLRQCGSFYKMAKLACSTLPLTARDYYTCMLVIFAECTVPLAKLGYRLNFVVAEVSLVKVVFPNALQLPAEQCLVSVPHLFTSLFSAYPISTRITYTTHTWTYVHMHTYMYTPTHQPTHHTHKHKHTGSER